MDQDLDVVKQNLSKKVLRLSELNSAQMQEGLYNSDIKSLIVQLRYVYNCYSYTAFEDGLIELLLIELEDLCNKYAKMIEVENERNSPESLNSHTTILKKLQNAFEIISKLSVFMLFDYDLIDYKRKESIAKNILDKISQLETDAEESLKNITEYSSTLTKLMPEFGVDNYISNFEEAKKTFDDYALNQWRWLKIMTGASVTIAVLMSIMVKYFNLLSNENILFYATTKLFILSMLYFSVSSLYKNFKVAKHNSMIYLQKIKSLQTFKIFYESAESKDVKDMILLQTTNTIFNHQNTGYFQAGENDAGSMDFITKLMSVIKK